MAEIKYGARRPVVLQVREPSMGMIQLGKISQVYPARTWAYLNNISAEMRKTGEYAVAPCVVDLLQAWGIQRIEYFDKATGNNYWTTTDALQALGQIKRYSYRPAYWHLKVGHWHREIGQPKSKFTTDTMTLEWAQIEIAEQPAQLALAI